MEKTKYGISVGLVGAFAYALALFGGLTCGLLLAGFVILMEQNPWLRRTVLKALAVTICFSLLTLLINFIPEIINWIIDGINMAGFDWYLTQFNQFFDLIAKIINIVRDITLVVLALSALNMSEINVPFVDNLLNKHLQ